jgi:transposase
MSTSLLYHALGIVDHEYQRTAYKLGGIIFHIFPKPKAIRCPICGGKDVICKGTVDRLFRDMPWGSNPVWIKTPVQRVWCSICDVVRQIKISFAEPKKRYTKKFKRYVLKLSQHMTIKDVAKVVGVSWDVVKEIQKSWLGRHYRKPKLKYLRKIAIDEFSVGKNHDYFTQVLDLDTGKVVFVGEGKGADALVPFWKRLKSSKASIQAVAIDMSPAYISAVLNNLPGVPIVFDRFHVVKMLNEKISNIRRQIYNKLDDEEQQKVLKGTRWLLLKNPENLDPSKDEEARLERALEINKPLATAYYMKEELRQLWDQSSKEEAAAFLQDWIERAMASGIKSLQNFAKTMATHRSGILAYYDIPITSGPIEGVNNKIKVLKRQAYGFRDREFFKLKIMALHEAKYALVG